MSQEQPTYPYPYPPPYQNYQPYLYPQQILSSIDTTKKCNGFIITPIIIILMSIILIIYGINLINDSDNNNFINSQNYTNNNYDPRINRFYTQGEILLMTPTDAIVESDPEISLITVNNRIVKTYITKIVYNARLSMTNTITQDIYSQITVNKFLEKGTKLTVYYQVGGRLTPPFLTNEYVTYPELNIFDDTNKKRGFIIIGLAILIFIISIYIIFSK
jgi:hypothetical protein